MTRKAENPPYPGLRAFARDEAMLFFGRENCVDAMIERLAATKFLAVLGASGSGKSSLVRTGLFSALDLGFFAQAGSSWRIVETHPGGAPMRNLAAALAGCANVPEDLADVEARLHLGRRSVIEWAGEGQLKPGENLLILVDQFEELFRYADYAAREEAESFVALLLESARSTESNIYVVITMRSEYLGACALISGLAEQVNASFYLTPRMSREECWQAIEGPAAVLGFEIEPALTNRILNDMAGFAPWESESGVAQGQILSRRADQLPLMQHLLNRLWLRARERANVASVDEHAVRLTAADYETAGGLVGALNAHGAEVLDALTPTDRALAPGVFRALVSGPDPTNAVRRPCQLNSLWAEAEERRPGDSAAIERIVEAFRARDCNFLQPPPEARLAGDSVIDISHESLIRQWTDLSGWLREEATAESNWRRLLMHAERYGAGEGELLAGKDLNTLADWWDDQKPTAAWAGRHGGSFPVARAFLQDSRKLRDDAAAERERQAVLEVEKAGRARTTLVALLTAVTVLFFISSGTIAAYILNGHTFERQRLEFIRQRTEFSHQQQQAEAKLVQARENADLVVQNARAEAKVESERTQKAADDLAKKTNETSKKIASIANGPGLFNAVEYCEEHEDEAACQKLLYPDPDSLRAGSK